MKQVDKNHYDFDRYSHEGRWVSYYNQLREVLALKPTSILEVGCGDKVFASFVKNNTGIEYKSMDVAEDLNSDILGSLEKIPCADRSFNVICAFEVLEHLTFEKFEPCLLEMKRVSSRYICISIPHFGPSLELSFKFPFLKRFRKAVKVPYHPAHRFNGEHYWELGKKGFEPKRIRNILKKNFVILKEFVPFGNQYHHFYILEKK